VSDEFDISQSIVERNEELQQLFATPYFEDFLYDLGIRTASFKTSVAITNVTAKNRGFYEANNGITVKLPANPKDNSEVIIANGDGTSITIDGNGTDIKYTTTSQTFITNNIGSSWHFHLFQNGTEKYWRVR